MSPNLGLSDAPGRTANVRAVSNEMTLAQFEVAVGELHDAIGTVQGCATAIDGYCSTIKQEYTSIEGEWVSPAGTTFAEATVAVNKVMDELTGLLADTLTRMRQTYSNYLEVEEQAVRNVTPAATEPMQARLAVGSSGKPGLARARDAAQPASGNGKPGLERARVAVQAQPELARAIQGQPLEATAQYTLPVQGQPIAGAAGNS